MADHRPTPLTGPDEARSSRTDVAWQVVHLRMVLARDLCR
jgi:hypothetical protein